MFMIPCIVIYSMKQPTDAAICSQFYSTVRFTLHCTPDDGWDCHPKHV